MPRGSVETLLGQCLDTARLKAKAIDSRAHYTARESNYCLEATPKRCLVNAETLLVIWTLLSSHDLAKRQRRNAAWSVPKHCLVIRSQLTAHGTRLTTAVRDVMPWNDCAARKQEAHKEAQFFGSDWETEEGMTKETAIHAYRTGTRRPQNLQCHLKSFN